MTVKGRPLTGRCRLTARCRVAAAAEPATSSWPPAGGRPSTDHHCLSLNSSAGRTPMRSACAAVHAGDAEQLGRHHGDVAAVGDRRDARQVRLADVRRARGHAADAHAAVGQRQAVRLRRHDDVGAVGLEVVLRLHGERAAQREQRHHRADADQQAGDQERGAALAAAQVAERDVAKLHVAPREIAWCSHGVSHWKYCAPACRLLAAIVRVLPETLRLSGIGLQPPVITLIWSLRNCLPQLLHCM